MTQFFICEMPTKQSQYQTKHKAFSTMPGTHVRNQQILLLLPQPILHKESLPNQGECKPPYPTHVRPQTEPSPQRWYSGRDTAVAQTDPQRWPGGLHTGRELHLQKCVGLMPVHLEWEKRARRRRHTHRPGASPSLLQPHLRKAAPVLPPAISVWKWT